MALDIPSNQIYAGRYHYQEQKIINILNNPEIKYNTEHKLMRDEHQIDKVTISDQAFAMSKDWRKASKDNPNINRTSYADVIAENNKLMNTTNLIDPVSMFNSEISIVSQQIRDDLENQARPPENTQSILAKAYQIIYKRIEEDFAQANRTKTYLRQADGSHIEETIDDRIKALNNAYMGRAEIAAAGAMSKANLANIRGQANYSPDMIAEIGQKIIDSYQNDINQNLAEKSKTQV